MAGTIAAGVMPAPASARPADLGCDYLPVDDIHQTFSIPGEVGLAFSSPTIDLQDGNRVVISTAVTATDSEGRKTTSGIIAVLIGLALPGASGFMDYTDDACMDAVTAKDATRADGTSNTILFAERQAASVTAARACAAIGDAWNDYLDRRLPRPSPRAMMFQIRDGIAQAERLPKDAPTHCVSSPRDPASGLMSTSAPALLDTDFEI